MGWTPWRPSATRHRVSRDERIISGAFCRKSYRFPRANDKRLCKSLPPKDLRTYAVPGTAVAGTAVAPQLHGARHRSCNVHQPAFWHVSTCPEHGCRAALSSLISLPYSAAGRGTRHMWSLPITRRRQGSGRTLSG